MFQATAADMKRLSLTLFAASLGAVACSGSSETLSTGNTALGIESFVVEETPTKLHILGIDKGGDAIGELLLELGRFTIPDDGRIVDGRNMTVRVHGKEALHTSEGLQPITLPVLDDKVGGQAISLFLVDDHVAPRLAKWGVSLTAQNPPRSPAATAERGYDGCTHSWPVSIFSCCEYQSGGNTYENGCSSSTYTFYNRSCSSGSSSACGGNGPNGCAPCWNTAYNCNCYAGDGSSCWGSYTDECGSGTCCDTFQHLCYPC
jgi:hypothetical protein